MPVEGQAMKRGSLLGWVGIAVLAGATAWVVYTSGGSPAAPAPTATVTPHIIIVPVTVTATPTATVTKAAPVVVPPTRTPRLSPNEVVTDAPTRAPTATATQWAAPTVPWAGEALALHAPNAEGLFEVVQLANQSLADFSYLSDRDEVTDQVHYGERDALERLVAADVVQHYSNGLPSTGSLLTTTVDLQTPPPASLVRLLRAAVIRHVLERAQYVLQTERAYSFGGVTLRASELEMDGDPGREWLVAVEYNHYRAQDWLVFYEDANGQPRYETTPWWALYEPHGAVDLDATHDFTGDGMPEIVIVTDNYMMGFSWENVWVYHWRSGMWQLVSQLTLTPGPAWADSTHFFELVDDNGDGRYELRVRTPRSFGFGCDDETVRDYVWDGQRMVETGSDPAVPETGACLIYRAENAGSLAGEARGFERVLTLLEVENAKPDLLAWARVQLAMRYAALGSESEAVALLEAASQAQGTGGYLDLLRQAVAQVGSQPMAVCAELYGQAVNTEYGHSLGTAIDDDLAYGPGPGQYEPVPERVCPLDMLTAHVLARVSLPADRSPAAALEAQGLSLAVFEPLALDSDADVEYVGLLAGPWRPVLVLDRQGVVWHLADTGVIGSADMAVAALAVPGASDSNVLVVRPADSVPFSWGCEGADVPLTLALLTRTSDGWEAALLTSQCADPALLDLSSPKNRAAAIAVLEAPTVDTATDTPPWMQLEGYAGQEPARFGLLGYVTELQTNVLERRYPLGTQAAITALLNYLPHDDANAQLVAVRLLYLRGLGYELAGDDAAAVAAYTDVLRAAPGSAWAWLAWARVGPVAAGG